MNNLKVLNIVEDGLIALGIGVTLSLEQIYTIFGIVLLSIQILLILTKGVIKLVNYLKQKKIEEAVATIEETQKEIEDVTGKKEHGNGQH